MKLASLLLLLQRLLEPHDSSTPEYDEGLGDQLVAKTVIGDGGEEIEYQAF